MTFHSWPNLGVSRGQNGGQKGQNVPFSRKNEYHDLEFCNFTLDRVSDLSLMLESGRLPVPIKLIQERDVDAVLGADSLSKSYYAAGIGLLLVVVFMVLYYRIPGIFASIALFCYCLIVIAVFKLLSVTLTLSGIAAAILSIGMAVDANVLIFERC